MKITIQTKGVVFRAMLPFISDDVTRFVICGLRFEIQDKTLRLIATDGRRMAVHEPSWTYEGEPCEILC